MNMNNIQTEAYAVYYYENEITVRIICYMHVQFNVRLRIKNIRIFKFKKYL